jgi:hypothetical protein
MTRVTSPVYRASQFRKNSLDTIKRLYGNMENGYYTTNKTLIKTKLCCDTDTNMVYYSFVRRGKVYPLSPYLKDGKFMLALKINDEDNTYLITPFEF